MRKVIYNANGKITGVSSDPRIESDVLTDIDAPEVFKYKVVDKKLVYSPPVFNLESAKGDKIKKLNKNADKLMEDFLSKYPRLEIESFEKKEKEANAYTLDNNAPVPFLTALVGGDRSKLPTLCQAILAKSAFSAQQEANVVRLRDAIKGASTKEELDAISVELKI